MLENNIVSKSNELNLRAYKLTRLEQLVILSIVSMIEPTDEDFKEYKLCIKDFLELLGIKDKTKYNQLPKITKGLMRKVIEIKRPHGLLQVAWLCSVEYDNLDGSILVQFAPKLKPYLLNLKNNFVSYKLQNVSKLTSKYSIRVYELLKQYEFKKVFDFNLEEFRLLIGLDEFEYPRYSNFKQKILLKTYKELKEKTDIKFEFEEIKTGRKVTGIRFYIEKNKNFKKEQKLVDQTKQEIAVTEATVTSELQSDDVAYNTYNNIEYNEAHGEEISEYDTFEFAKNIFKDKEITGLDAKKVYDAAVKTIKKKNLNISVLEFLIKKKIIVNDYSKTHTLKRGYMATLMAAIKEDWDKPERQVAKQKDSFTNYHQRTYDFEELERKLLGWDKVEPKEEDEE